MPAVFVTAVGLSSIWKATVVPRRCPPLVYAAAAVTWMTVVFVGEAMRVE